jgi:radical SAM family uncharacterized protein
MSRTLKEKAAARLRSERGAVVKPAGAAVSVALAYPNTYHVGMSNLGLHQVYSLLNERSDTVCERVFLPDDEDRSLYEQTGERLASLESSRPIADFDIVAFSVSFEQDYLNVLAMLRLAGIPLRAADRTADHPLVVLGGICSFFNPEPLAEFFDAVVVGEAEEAAGEFLDAYLGARGADRRGLLRVLSAVSGVYIPSFYDVLYHNDNSIRERVLLEPSAPSLIRKRTATSLSSRPAVTKVLTPDTEFSNMQLAEITRGCGRHCRFCMAGYIYLPPRGLDADRAREAAERANKAGDKIGLVGAAISDYEGIAELCAAIEGSLSVSSLRADSVSRELIERLAKSGHKTVAIAPEAGSERMRRVINKGVTEEDILRAADMIFRSGIPNLKLYFIIGLPTETAEDIEAVITLAERVHAKQLEIARPLGRIGRTTLSINSFVPKPFTPFQWEPMEPIESLNRKVRTIERAVRRIGNMNLIHDLPKWEHVQALLSRGDRRVGRLLEAVLENNGDWKRAARELGMDPEWYAGRRRGFDEALPWDFIDIGVRKDYLRNEFERACEGKSTPPCRVGSCRTCGVCK